LTNWGLARIFARCRRTESSVGIDSVPEPEGSGLSSEATEKLLYQV
jgi:hypothetical protein